MVTVKDLLETAKKLEGHLTFSPEDLQKYVEEIEKAYEKEIAEKDKEIEELKNEIKMKDLNYPIKLSLLQSIIYDLQNQPKLYKEDFKKVDHYNRCDGNCCHPKKCDGKGTSWFTYELKDNSQWDKLESKEVKVCQKELK